MVNKGDSRGDVVVGVNGLFFFKVFICLVKIVLLIFYYLCMFYFIKNKILCRGIDILLNEIEN